MASSGAPLCSSALVLLPCLFVIAMAALESGVVVLADAADTVAADRPLSGRQRPLVSNRGKFALGFFQPAAHLALRSTTMRGARRMPATKPTVVGRRNMKWEEDADDHTGDDNGMVSLIFLNGGVGWCSMAIWSAMPSSIVVRRLLPTAR
uniref:Serine/threonine-protein kinase n=1 Tax=Oryza glumipatula TaxID=40148 RepID=A0A0D9YI04_9ORYZ